MPNSLVLDSSAVIAFLEKEPGYQDVAELFHRLSDGELQLGVTVVNLSEVWYRFARAFSEQVADQVVADLLGLGVEVVDVGWRLALQAGAYKARGGIAFADCFAAALAKAWDTAVVTGDPEFRQLEREIKIQWIGEAWAG